MSVGWHYDKGSKTLRADCKIEGLIPLSAQASNIYRIDLVERVP